MRFVQTRHGQKLNVVLTAGGLSLCEGVESLMQEIRTHSLYRCVPIGTASTHHLFFEHVNIKPRFSNTTLKQPCRRCKGGVFTPTGRPTPFQPFGTNCAVSLQSESMRMVLEIISDSNQKHQPKKTDNSFNAIDPPFHLLPSTHDHCIEGPSR